MWPDDGEESKLWEKEFLQEDTVSTKLFGQFGVAGN
jgi:hypothetical protein